MKKVSVAIISMMVVFIFFGCKSDGTKKTENETVTKSETSFDMNQLYGKQWNLTQVFNKQLTSKDSLMKQPYIQFDENQKLTGNGGCNQISGDFKVHEDQTLKISKLISTKMACPALAIEDEFMKALEQASTFVIINETLVLGSSDKKKLAQFEAAYLK